MSATFLAVILVVIAYFSGNFISRISGTLTRFLSLALFLIAPIILWFTAVYVDGCWPNVVGQERCMWVPFGMLVLTVPYIFYCIAAITGYVLGRRKLRAV